VATENSENTESCSPELWCWATDGSASMVSGTSTVGLEMLADHRSAESSRVEGTSGLQLVQPSCSQQGQLEHVVQGSVHSGFYCLHRWGLHNLCREHIALADNTHSKEVFCVFKWNFLYFTLCPQPPVFSQDVTEKRSAPYSFLSHQVFTHGDKISLSLLFSRLDGHSCLTLSSYVRCCCPVMFLAALCWTCCRKSVSFLYWEPRSRPRTPNGFHQCWVEGKR